MVLQYLQQSWCTINAMKRAESKANRLLQIETLLLAHPEGLTQAEIARKLQVDRSTINRYLADLPGSIYIDEDDGDKLKIDRNADLINVTLNLHEAMALHLASRLIATRMDRKNPNAASALRKLSSSMERWADRISGHIRIAADMMDDESQKDDPNYIRILELVTECWANLRKVKIWHRSDRMGKVFTYTVSPYFIEPYAIGQTTQLIGFSEPPGALRTYKIERIERAEKTNEEYMIPETFDPRILLADAWGIWYSEDEAVHVTLRFTPRVANRVKESRWHHSQQIHDQQDGSLLWQADIATPKEMLPWIRGWGSDCEVLEPTWLREKLLKEVQKMARVYGVGEVILKDNLIAHVRKNGEEQSLFTHLTETSEWAGKFAGKVGLQEIGKIMGLMHDFGKASKDFQDYLHSATGKINPDEDEYVDYKAKKGKIDHSTAGAQLIYTKLVEKGQIDKVLAQYLALAIVSHHSGLIDCLKPDGFYEFYRRITKDTNLTNLNEARGKLSNIEKQIDELLEQPIAQKLYNKLESMKGSTKISKPVLAFKYGLLARFMLSCLLEADRLNTADFEHPGNAAIRNYGNYISWEILCERLEMKYRKYHQETAQMKPGRALEVNKVRAQVAQACLDAAKKPKGIYQLTVPTGGGKTEASLRFALHHVHEYRMDRIFYIVPYITIIEQNADMIRKILEPVNEKGKVVLEHHSNFIPEDDTRYRYNLLSENWDAPIVFTTQVQFLESLFGSGTRDARRMHQLANSVIIFDEVHTIPVKIIHMFSAALRFLTNDCGSTVVLCTATQPPLDNLFNEYRKLTIEPDYKIIHNETELFQKLKRVEVNDERKPGGWDNSEIADLADKALREKGSVLIVVNTRASAKNLYEEIKSRHLTTTIYHLSTNMCPEHRSNVLEDEIKPKLKKGEPVICVSTQLIEAGVNIDFGAVIRSLAGLDSIVQSAGRCNRHGLRENTGSVWVVNIKEENLDRLRDIRIGSDHSQRILDDFKNAAYSFEDDRIGLLAITAYYSSYYSSQKDKMNFPVGPNSSVGRNDDLFNLLSINDLSFENYKTVDKEFPDILLRQSFRTANSEFHVMDSPSRGVVVPYRDGAKIIIELCGAYELDKQWKLLKQAQRYSVNLFDHQMKKLLEAGVIREAQEGAGIYYLDKQYYSNEYGWSENPVSGMDTLLE